MMYIKATLFFSVALAMASLQSYSEVTVAQDAMLSTYLGGSKADALSGAAGQCRDDLATLKPDRRSGDEAGDGFLVVFRNAAE